MRLSENSISIKSHYTQKPWVMQAPLGLKRAEEDEPSKNRLGDEA